MISALETIQEGVIGKAPLLGAVFSSIIGLATEAAVGASNINTVMVVALCGAAGAFFGSLPRIIAARSGADASARNLLAKELRLLLARIHLLDQRVVLEQAAKHKIQSEHNNLVVHVKNLEALLRNAGAEVPSFKIKSYEDIFGLIDKEIKELMLAEREEAE